MYAAFLLTTCFAFANFVRLAAAQKRTKWYLKPVFATRLKAKPFFIDNYDAFVVKLSKLYDLVRNKGSPVEGDSAAGGAQQNFERETTKYWVHPDNITELKLIILKVGSLCDADRLIRVTDNCPASTCPRLQPTQRIRRARYGDIVHILR